jgi:hypothetical protein
MDRLRIIRVRVTVALAVAPAAQTSHVLAVAITHRFSAAPVIKSYVLDTKTPTSKAAHSRRNALWRTHGWVDVSGVGEPHLHHAGATYEELKDFEKI